MRVTVGHHPLRFRALVGALAVVTLTAAGCGGSAEVDKSGGAASEKPVELVLAHHDNGTQHIEAWIDAVERLSGGSLRVTASTGWRAGEANYERATIGDLRDGKVPLATVAARAFDEVGVTTFQPLVAPMLIDSRELEDVVIRGEIGRAALSGASELELVGLALLPTEMRRPFGISRALAAPQDWRDARIYTREGAVARETLRAFGAEPVHKSLEQWAEEVDGAEIGLSAVASDRRVVRRSAGITANVVLWPQPLTVVAGSDVLDRLSDAQKEALKRAGEEAFVSERTLVNTLVDEQQEIACRLGMKSVVATAAQIDALRAAVEPVYEIIERSAANREAIKRIRALKGDALPEALRCDSPEKPVTAGAGEEPELRGTYATTLSKRELEQSPLLMDGGEINDENWGDLTLRLDDGRVRLTQRNAVASGEVSGRYTTNGDVLELIMDDIGETFTFRWSLYEGTLKLERDEALGVAPTPLVAKPFRRVD